MRAGRRWRYGSLSAVAAGLLCFGALAAQAPVVRGRIVDPSGRPVADLPVVLHAVTPAGGQALAEGRTGSQGEFELRPAGNADSSAVFFVAVRYEGDLYIGPTVEAGQATPDDQLIQVGGPGALQLSEAAGSGQQAPAPGGRSALLLLGLLLAAGLGVLALRGLDPARNQREALLRLAELEERFAGEAQDQDEFEREAYQRKRDKLRNRLRSG